VLWTTELPLSAPAYRFATIQAMSYCNSDGLLVNLDADFVDGFPVADWLYDAGSVL